MRSTLQRLRHDDGGWVLATAIGLMAIMLSLFLATAAVTDNQQKQSGVDRQRESSFNLAEAALTAQVFALANDQNIWPGKGMAGSPFTPCTGASSGSRCPDAASMAKLLASPDAGVLVWRTEVRDNVDAAGTGRSEFYSDALTATSPGYDRNDDGKLWVRAEATTRGRKRTLVTMVKVEMQGEVMPHAAVRAGRLDISNQGNKIIIDGSGAAAGTRVVQVLCQPTLGETVPCLGHELGHAPTTTPAELEGKLRQQVSPYDVQPAYSNGAPPPPSMDAESLERLKNTAIADGTYFASCPPALPTVAKVTWIESGACDYQSNNAINTPQNPGVLILNNATLEMEGTFTFYGVIYAINPTNSTGTVIELGGGGEVQGGVIIDGPGMLVAGSNKLNVKLDENAFNNIRSYVTAGVVQHTWREIKSG